MNIIQAIKSGKPFSHPEMIGAFLVVNGGLTHHDNVNDYLDMNFVVENAPTHPYANFMEVGELTRDDWFLIEFIKKDNER